MTKTSLHAHKMVMLQAVELANAGYDNLMSNNAIYSEWKRKHPNMGPKALRAAFLKKYLFAHIEPARATLAGMLNLPIDPNLKNDIHEALVLDATLMRGRGRRLPGMENLSGS